MFIKNEKPISDNRKLVAAGSVVGPDYKINE